MNVYQKQTMKSLIDRVFKVKKSDKAAVLVVASPWESYLSKACITAQQKQCVAPSLWK